MIVLANTKGGVGKSTLAVHLAVWLYEQGFPTALLDTDRQRSSSLWVSEAEPGITVRTADTPEQCLTEARDLLDYHDFVIGDGQAALDDLSRTMLVLADVALLPITPSILDIRSVQQATGILRIAQQLNGGRPEGRLVLNRMKTRDRISQELMKTSPELGVSVGATHVRDLQAFRDSAQQGTVVMRMGKKGTEATFDICCLFDALFRNEIEKRRERHGTGEDGRA